MKKLLIILLLLLISKISFALSKAETEELINESIKTYFEPNGQKRRLSDIEGIWKSEEGIVIEEQNSGASKALVLKSQM